MSVHSLPTQFAPAQRASKKRLQQETAQVAAVPLLRPLLDAIPDIILVLNQERQIVFANRALADLIRLEDPDSAIGFRPGEVLDCIHASETEGGCGTTEFCSTCGAVLAILASLDGANAVEDCRVSLKNGDALDLQVYATPLPLDSHNYAFFVLRDVSHEKRRRMLERVFFHDILNSAGAMRGLADLMQRLPPGEKDEVAGDLALVCDRMIDEINSQKILLAAESNELTVENRLINAGQFLEELLNSYQGLEIARSRTLRLEDQSCPAVFLSDRSLLRRVLGNMLKNALEASQPGECVTLGCRDGAQRIEFWVHNPGAMPPEVRLQIFKRSFSTKGAGRGLGTYSIKLLGERYLRGKVGFTSSVANGTVFKISLPLE